MARKLLGASVVTEAQIRVGLEAQAALLSEGKSAPLVDLLVERGILPTVTYKALSAPDPIEGQPFPNYRIEKLLGEGGSSRVYRAKYLPNGATVAVKVLDPVQGLRADLKERFYDEARLLIELDHENVVAGYEVGSAKGLHFFSMDYVVGPTVLEMIERAEHLEHGTALWITIQMAKALAHLHSRNLIHRDIKPGNVMIDATGRARLIDLGLVRRLDDVTAEQAGGEDEKTVGTVEYISPEQARGRGDLDIRTDIYSLGVTLYHMVVGDVPFHGETSYEVMAKHILSGMDAQKVKTRRIPPEINFVIAKMTSKEREHRHANCDEVVADLSRFLPAGGPPPIILPIAPEEPEARPMIGSKGKPFVMKPPAPSAPVARPPVMKPSVATPLVVAPPVVRPPVARPPVMAPPVMAPPVIRPPVAPPTPPPPPPAQAPRPPMADIERRSSRAERDAPSAPDGGPAVESPKRAPRPPREGPPKRRGAW